jgi:hypothetical protein
MKTLRKILWLLLAAVSVGAAVHLVACHRQQSTSPLDGLYARYSQCDGLTAALVRGKGIPCDNGDSIRVDLLMLSADDGDAWQRLRDDFGIPEPLPPMQQRIDQGSDIVSVRRIDDNQAVGANIRVASYLNHQVSIINAASDADIDLVRHHSMEMNINQTKNIQS